jgi:hypothetical protein
MGKTVEVYVRSAQHPRTVRPLTSTYLGDKDREYSIKSLSCPSCGHPFADLATIRQHAGGWPDVLSVICDLGFHRLE